MSSSFSPATNSISTNVQSAPLEESRARLVRLIGRITTLGSGIFTIALIYSAVNHTTWQIIATAISQTASWLVAGFSLLPLIKHAWVRVFLLITSILVMMAGYSIFISGQSISSALVALVFTLVIASISLSGPSAVRGMIFGGFFAWAISLIGLLSPYDKIFLPAMDFIMPAFLGILVIIYLALLVSRRVTATLRLKMVVGSTLIVIIPILVVAFFQASIAQNKVVNQILVLYMQPESTLSDLASAQQRLTLLIVVFLAGLVAMITALFSRTITRPISQLTAAAQKIYRGDLSASAVISNDEIGLLAKAFNTMTGRLRETIAELELRESLLTSELAGTNEGLAIRRQQIQTVSEVARAIAAAQVVDTLMDQITDIVSSRFNFYHVGIFLVDEKKEFAVLRASNSEGGKRMLSHHHMLRIGQMGIVGKVCESGEARIATDVGFDAVFFNNPDLPRTRSEMALPLVGGGKIIGALDVQSTQPNAFSQEYIELFSILADQIAIAVLNSRALEETQRALVEAQMVHRQYLQQEWNRELAEKEHHTYEYTPQGLVIRDRVESQDINSVFSTGKMVMRNSIQNHPAQEPAVLGMPIKLRGETIGIIHLQDESDVAREWVNEDIQIVQTIADQVAQALENARLFQQTVRRADRERKVIEISSKIRSSNDPEIMLQIAVEELQHALHASKTQVILNQKIEKPDAENSPSNGSGYPGPSNGTGKSPLA